jgi:uncharacterized protein with PQ loop repeat
MNTNLSNGQTLAWIFSCISNSLWLLVFIPQLYTNYKNKNSEALSLLLLFCLIFGDIFSCISAIYKDLNYVIIFSAIYHIFLDIIIILQVIYYRVYNDILTQIYFSTNNIHFYEYIKFLNFSESFFLIFQIILILIITFLLRFLNDDYSLILADLIAWISTSIFILARIPQILLNHKRQSTQGLSIVSFIIINISSLFFLLSILILLVDINESERLFYLKTNLQWISGCIFTTFFDLIIFYQFYKYKNYISVNTDEL